MAQYVASAYTTTPLPERATAVLAAIEHAQGVSSLSSPIKDMEDVSAGALPDLGAFLPLELQPKAAVRHTVRRRYVRNRVIWQLPICLTLKDLR